MLGLYYIFIVYVLHVACTCTHAAQHACLAHAGCSVTERSRTGPEILVRGTNCPRKFGPGGTVFDQISMVYITIHAFMTISDTAVQAMIRNQCEV